MAAPTDRRPLADRARPERLANVAGNPRTIAALRSWGLAWQAATPPRQRAALLEGPPGTGKTTAALALAAEMSWEVVEMNASDARNEAAIERVAGRAAITQTLSAMPGPGPRHALILLDEADCLTGRAAESAVGPRRPKTDFREFLRARYGTVAALAHAWKLDEDGRRAPFVEWAEVPATGGRGAGSRSPEAQRDLADWRESVRPHDTTDRGGLGAIARLVRSTHQPVVLTVNDARPLTRYSPVFRTGVARFRFERLGDREVGENLRRVARREGLRLSAEAVAAIVRRAAGDLRAALNDVEAVSAVPAGPLQLGLLGTRDRQAEFAEFVEAAFATPRLWRSVEVQAALDATPDDLLPWVEENAPRFARTASGLAAGVGAVAAADRLLSLARRWRVYRLWSYSSEMMVGGVPLEIDAQGGTRPGRVGFPTFLGEMGRSRTLRAVRNSLAEKAGRASHLSRRKARQELLPVLEAVFGGPRSSARRALCHDLAADLALTPEEVGLLVGAPPESAAVLALVAPHSATPNEEAEPPTPSPVPATGPDPAAKKTRVQRSLGEY